jgi:ribosomal protein S18 acetylase RimI-like enzyme
MENRIDIAVAPAETLEDIDAVRGLFRDYAQFMGFELCFDGFDKELAGLPGPYAPPGGDLLLCRVGGAPAGCVATSRLASGVAELKRLYVRPEYREMKIGRNLTRLAMDKAGEAGYVSIRLETIPDRMATADRMYRKLGFERVACAEGTDSRIVCYSRPLADLTEK